MIHYNVCNDKGKYWTILWASGNYCGRLDPVIPSSVGFWPSLNLVGSVMCWMRKESLIQSTNMLVGLPGGMFSDK